MMIIKRAFLIACAALLALSLTAAAADAAQVETARFAPGDMNVCYLYAGATKDEAAAVFGKPSSTESMTFGATEETVEIWHYDGLTLTFADDGTLFLAEVSGAAYTGPRGVALGQTLDDVTGKFYRDPNSASEDVLYTSGYVENTGDQFPPCGYIQRFDDGTFAVNYVAPTEPFGPEVLSDPMDFMYEQLATFTVIFDKDSMVTGYNWELGPWAE